MTAELSLEWLYHEYKNFCSSNMQWSNNNFDRCGRRLKFDHFQANFGDGPLSYHRFKVKVPSTRAFTVTAFDLNGFL